MVGGGEGNVIFEEMGKFSCKSRGELGSSVRDNSVMKTELGEDVLEEDFSDVHHRGSFVARVENYPLQKTMVYHDQNRIVAVGDGKVSNEVHGNLLERVGAFGGNRGKQGVGWMDVDLVGLTHGASGDESPDEGSHAGPPVVSLEQGDGVEVTAVSSSEGLVDVSNEGVAGGFEDIEAQLVVEGTLVKVPVPWLGVREWYSVCFYGSESVDNKLVTGGEFGDLGGKGSIEHVDLKVREENL